ncbi:hypothetical protein M9458_008616, partial [Cirrhinus mrigala]
MSKQSNLGDIKRHLRSQASEQPPEGETVSPQPGPENEMSQDIANIYTMLKKISDDMGGIEDIRRTTTSVESKLSALITRIDDVEKRVEFLKETENERQRNPSASKCELDQLKDKVEDMENRNRQNNLRVIGVSEGKEGGNMMRYMGDLISTVFDTSGRQMEIERAHRVFGSRPNPEDRPRPILVREKGEIQYEGNRIQIFPDFARATQLKREKFRECRRARGVKFAMMYPATLR